MNVKKKISKGFLFIIVYFLFWPVRVDPDRWFPPPFVRGTGMYQTNFELEKLERLDLKSGRGPEDVAVDKQGRIYCGLKDGRIVRLQPNGQGFEEFANTHGRPLGMHFNEKGDLIVADSSKGLLHVSPDGQVKILATGAEGDAFRFTNDVDIAQDGMIYFTDASSKYSVKDYKLDIVEHRGHGRLLSYNPKTKETKVLLSHLYFANGVALSTNEDYILVNETSEYWIRRFWLKGDKKGSSDIFIKNLPGFPDGISSNRKGIYWVAISSPRNKMLDAISPYPFIRKMLIRLPDILRPKPEKCAFVLGLNDNAEVIYNLQDPKGKNLSVISSVQQYKDDLYLGSLTEKALGRFSLKK